MLEPKAVFWYKWCRQNHKSCSARSRPSHYQRPTRLVEIDGSTWKSWMLIDNAAATLPNAPYASLSHCWGRKLLLTLTSSTISEMKRGMPVSKLPKTFQDAIIVAKHLSIQHLWIDSTLYPPRLCARLAARIGENEGRVHARRGQHCRDSSRARQ